MADFLNILTWSPQQLICIITYQKFQGEGRSVALEVYNDVIGCVGFFCNRSEIKHFKKYLKMLTTFHTCSLHYKHPELRVAY